MSIGETPSSSALVLLGLSTELFCYNRGMKRVASKRKVRQFTVVIEQDEDGYYVATVPSLPSCYTQARTLQELAPRIREVIALCLAEQDAPRMKFVTLEQVEVSA
jgi:predicted RNase H-like HicB family nuclease